MSTNSADAVANLTKNEEANRNLAAIRPSFIVNDGEAPLPSVLGFAKGLVQ